MNVIIAMTVDTLLWRIIEPIRLVATRAPCFTVRPYKWKTGKTVIEQHTFGPPILVVTLSAGFSELILVSIFLAMTGVAIRVQTGFMHRGRMTPGATDVDVPAQ